ncbi:hypothetical protein ACFQ14_10520 [Pseudahrensia aquimaris]|uniref:Uncharacterized protein n=1 Tax=Pseudahrensia aquimaris TaxID=744461 RepID=A0ABW3FJA2_9HYPH
MTRIPEYQRGFRDGCRAIVTALHAAAREETYGGSLANFHCTADMVGRFGSWCFHFQLLSPEEQSIALRKSPPNRYLTRMEPVLAILVAAASDPTFAAAAQRHHDMTGRPTDYMHGYMIGIIGALEECKYRDSYLIDPLAKHPLRKFINGMQDQLDVLLMAKEPIWVRWPKPIRQIPRRRQTK